MFWKWGQQDGKLLKVSNLGIATYHYTGLSYQTYILVKILQVKLVKL